MYLDPSLIRDKYVRSYYNEHEKNEVDLAVAINGGQRAELIRLITLDWARSVIASAPQHVVNRSAFGVVRSNGEIKYRFCA